MYHAKSKLILILSLLMLLATPQVSTAAPVFSTGADSAEGGVSFRIAYNEGIYEVYMTPSTTPDSPGLTLTAQVTIKVPHSATDEFTITNLTSAVDGTAWAQTSRINAPTEDPTADYISFEVDFPGGDYRAFDWVAEQEIKVFSFETSNACLGVVSLLENDDAFATLPNSAGTNPGNQINVFGMSGDNVFNDVTGTTANCVDGTDRALEFSIYLPITLK